jgi:hypothetical protein
MDEIKYHITPSKVIIGKYDITLEDGNKGEAYLIKMQTKVIPQELITKIKKDKNIEDITKLNIFHFSFFPFGENNKKYEGKGIASKIYDELNLEYKIDTPAIIFARSIGSETIRTDNLLKRKNYQEIRVNGQEHTIKYKLILE